MNDNPEYLKTLPDGTRVRNHRKYLQGWNGLGKRWERVTEHHLSSWSECDMWMEFCCQDIYYQLPTIVVFNLLEKLESKGTS